MLFFCVQQWLTLFFIVNKVIIVNKLIFFNTP